MSKRTIERQIAREQAAGQFAAQRKTTTDRLSVSGLRCFPESPVADRELQRTQRDTDDHEQTSTASKNTHSAEQRISLTGYCRDVGQAWDRFWFTPAPPFTLAMIRILAGGMLFYTHLIWTIHSQAFFGSHSWLTNDIIRDVHQGSYAWSYLWYIDSPALLLGVHLAALVVLGMLTIGWFTRITSVLAAIITLSYCHRLTGSLFGLDQINAMLAMYLAIGQCGGAYSFDRWLARRATGQGRAPQPAIATNLAIRLIQIHMCVIYLFGGIGKMRGEMWWDGSALWYAIANYEYQSVNVRWLVRYPWFIALLTHITVFWETFYAFLVWPRYTRPVMLVLAVFVHAGIAIFLGMPTFGIAMIIGNLGFIQPETVRRIVEWGSGKPLIFTDEH